MSFISFMKTFKNTNSWEVQTLTLYCKIYYWSDEHIEVWEPVDSRSKLISLKDW